MRYAQGPAVLLILAATFPALVLAEGTAATKGDPAKGQSLASTVCAACHGPDGNSPIPQNPSIAAQHATYLYKQLADFKTGRRKNPIMAGIAAGLSDEDMRNVAAYYATQKPRPDGAKDRTLASAGQKLYRGGDSGTGLPACSACHSPNGVGIPAQYPRLAGQHGDYTTAQLQLFRSGDRGNDPNGMMRTIAARLSDKEIAALADYIAGLR
jgi:cytochrome c553